MGPPAVTRTRNAPGRTEVHTDQHLPRSTCDRDGGCIRRRTPSAEGIAQGQAVAQSHLSRTICREVCLWNACARTHGLLFSRNAWSGAYTLHSRSHTDFPRAFARVRVKTHIHASTHHPGRAEARAQTRAGGQHLLRGAWKSAQTEADLGCAPVFANCRQSATSPPLAFLSAPPPPLPPRCGVHLRRTLAVASESPYQQARRWNLAVSRCSERAQCRRRRRGALPAKARANLRRERRRQALRR